MVSYECELPSTMILQTSIALTRKTAHRIMIQIVVEVMKQKNHEEFIFSIVIYCEKELTCLLQTLLVTCCRSCSLKKISRYLLQNSLVTCCRSSSMQKTTCYLLQNSVVTRSRLCSLQKIHSLLVAEVACCKKFTRYSLQKNNSLLVAKFARCLLQRLLVIHCRNSQNHFYEI